MIATFITIFLLINCNKALFSNEASKPFELNLKNNRWNAQVIAVKGDHNKSYIPAKNSLTEINHKRYVLVQEYASDIHVSTFSLNAEFGWTDQRIGNEWAEFWYPYEIHFSVRQSLPYSKWSINGKKFEISGSAEQDIVVQMGRMTYRLDKLVFKSETPGNKLVFSSVKIVRPSVMRYFRKNIVIDKDVINSEIVISTSPNYKLYINGKLAAEKGAGSTFSRVYNTFIITPYLKKGNNCISLECESCYWEKWENTGQEFCNTLFLEGIIIFTDGTFKRIYTDGSWKASFSFNNAWNRLDYDDSSWPYAKSLGNVGKAISGFQNGGKGFYTNPPYMGPIIIEIPGKTHPFFSEIEPVSFSIGAYLNDQSVIDTSCTCTIYDFVSLKKITTLELDNKTYASPKITYEFPELTLFQGSYLLEVTLKTTNRTIDTRLMEFLVLGPLKDSTEDNKKQLVDSINCSNFFTLQSFIAAPFLLLKQNEFGFFSRLKKTPFGNYRETMPKPYSWLSYKFTVKNLYKPHIISVYYPDDHTRTMGIVIHEKPVYKNLNNLHEHDAALRSSTGIYTGDSMNLSSKLRKLDFIYWPNVKEATMTFINCEWHHGAAVHKIEVYELSNELPSLSINNDLNQMLVGTMSERAHETLPRTFYAGELKNKFIQNLNQMDFTGYYKAWYITLKNFIGYMKHTGQNLFIPSAYMYYAAQYPSVFSGFAESGIQLIDEREKDYLALMATMFEYNNLSLLLGIEFMGTKQTRNEYDNCTDIKLRNTMEKSRRLISRNGKQCYTFWGKAGLNPIDTDNVKKYVSVIDDCASKYKDFSAIKGFVFYVTGELFPSFGPFRESNPTFPNNSLDWGYGDLTINEFECDTGITVPVDNTNSKRFAQRYKYLMTNHKDQWIRWREQKIRSVLNKATNTIKHYRKDWDSMIVSRIPLNNDIPRIMQQNLSLKELHLNAGIDTEAYKEESNNIVWMPMIRASGARTNRFYKQNYTNNFLINTYNTLDELKTIFDFGLFSAAFIHTGFFPECTLTTEKPWVWQNIFCLAYPLPPDNYYLKPFSETMSLLTPSTMILFWTDITHQVGHEQQLAQFTQVYRTLPKIKYKTIVENNFFAIKGNSWKNDFYFFIINKKPYNQTIAITLNQNQIVCDLSKNEVLEVTDNKFNACLYEYAIKSYKIANCKKIPIIQE